jgi:hypothetical protein
MQSSGIQHVFTLPDGHAQNRKVEHVHFTILDGVLTTLADFGLDVTFWPKAAAYLAYTRNYTPCGSTKFQTMFGLANITVLILAGLGFELYLCDYCNRTWSTGIDLDVSTTGIH